MESRKEASGETQASESAVECPATATWKPRFLYLLDIEAIRGIPESQLENALTHCERISYREWIAAKGKMSRRKLEKWHLVLNPPEPFLPVTSSRLKRCVWPKNVTSRTSSSLCRRTRPPPCGRSRSQGPPACLPRPLHPNSQTGGQSASPLPSTM